MEIKILQVFYGKDGLPYKDKDRQVHFPIAGTGFLGASNTTQIKFYYDELDETNQTTWVAVSKLPNGKLGSRVLESYLDDELNEHYALLELGEYYTQYKGDVFISLQGYQGGVNLDFNEETQQYEIHGTPTIAATGSIKFAINYANQFVGSGQTDNINFQRILAALGTKLGMRAYSEHVEELPSEGSPDVFYVVNDDPNNPNIANIYVWNQNTRHYIWVGDNTLDLGNYYTHEQGDQFEENIGEQVGNLNDRVESVENELGSVAQGSPKGVYATLSALESAYPTGTTGIYVVSANGHWYYWNGSAWTDGGVYQATGIADGDAFKPFGVVTSSSNLNDYMTIGSYWVESGSQTNKPSDFGNGMLLVFTSNYLSYNPLFQMLISSDGLKYTRRKYGTSWTSWEKQKGGFYGKTFVETDFDNYTEEGSYWIPSGTTIEHKPTTDSGWNGMLLVFSADYGTTTHVIFQIAFNNTDIYIRRKYGSSWNSWNLQLNGFYGKGQVATDLNDYVVEGSYWKPSGTTIANDPKGNSWNGSLLVFTMTTSNNTKVVWQVLMNSDTYCVRRKFGDTWGAWADLKNGFYGKTFITSDFNNYTEEGSYWIPSGVSISNSPNFQETSWNGLLVVFTATYSGNNVVFQIAFNNGSIYIRRKYGNNWTAWTDNKMSNSPITSKTWYACGDSFTIQGYGPTDPGYGTDSVLQEGIYAGMNAVYPYYIGNRTNCIVKDIAVGGMTISYPNNHTPSFTYDDWFKNQIGADADLITLYFGINDSGYGAQIGDIDSNDITTFCGAYNYVLSWLLENRPNARIGIIVSNGTGNADFVNATIAIAKKWGIPYLNIDGDPMLPLVIRTITRPDLSDARKQQFLEDYSVNYPSNTHPNYKAHEKESYMIQQFLERL